MELCVPRDETSAATMERARSPTVDYHDVNLQGTWAPPLRNWDSLVDVSSLPLKKRRCPYFPKTRASRRVEAFKMLARNVHAMSIYMYVLQIYCLLQIVGIVSGIVDTISRVLVLPVIVETPLSFENVDSPMLIESRTFSASRAYRDSASESRWAWRRICTKPPVTPSARIVRFHRGFGYRRSLPPNQGQPRAVTVFEACLPVIIEEETKSSVTEETKKLCNGSLATLSRYMGTSADKGISAPPERQQRHGSFSWVGVRPGQHILDLAFRRRQAKSGNQRSPAPRPPIVGPTVTLSSTFLSRATDFLLHPHNGSDGHEIHTWADIKLNSISTSKLPHSIALDASTTILYPTTQVQLSTKQLAWERTRVREVLQSRIAERKAATESQRAHQKGVETINELQVHSLNKKTPAQHTGFIRQIPMGTLLTVLMGASLAVGPSWEKARLLVDSGSEHPPLISQNLANRMGLTGYRMGGATQADGKVLPLYDVGNLELAVNGQPVQQKNLSAPLSHYDVILGESWLQEHKGIMDYAHNELWQWSSEGVQPLRFDKSTALPAPGLRSLQQEELWKWEAGGGRSMTFEQHAPETGIAYTSTVQWQEYPQPHMPRPGYHPTVPIPRLTDKPPALQEMLAAAVEIGLERARIHAISETPLSSRLAIPQLQYIVPGTAGCHRRERRQSALTTKTWARHGLHMLGDVGKELPEDSELDRFQDAQIPGLVEPTGRAFDFVEKEVRAQLKHVSSDMQEDIIRILEGFEPTVFETRVMPRLPPFRELDMDIPELEGSRPVAARPYPVAPQNLPELNRQLRALLEAGMIRRSVSPYAAPTLFTPKKDGKLRLCNDYRRLNKQTQRDCFPTPIASDLIARTRGARMFSKLDLQAGFNQLRIREGDQHKTAFITPSGLYEWVVCPFGLSNTPGCFQRLMNHVLSDHIEAGYCVVFCDDVAIFTDSDDPSVHMEKLVAVLETLREHNLLVKGSKTELFRSEIEFLGFTVSAEGWAPTESKVGVVVDWPAPATVKHLRSFLGMAKNFRTFLPRYSEMAAPLTDLLKNSGPGHHSLNWSVACEESFNLIKRTLTSAPVLRHFDPALRTAIHIDGSQNAVGAVLLQWHDGEIDPRPVAFMSRKLAGAQFRYDARNVEALAAQMALQTWRTLLLGQKFEIYSDHDSLKFLFTQKDPSQRILRLCEFMADFNFTEVKYVPGPNNVVPDFLSRPWADAAGGDVDLVNSRPLHMLSHPPAVRQASIHALRHDSQFSVRLTPTWAGHTDRQRMDTKGLWPADTLDFAAAVAQGALRPASNQLHRSVVVMPTWQGKIAVQQRQGASGLWSTDCISGEDSKETVQRVLLSFEKCDALGHTERGQVDPTLRCVT